MKAYEGAPSSVKSSKPMTSRIYEGVKAVSAILLGDFQTLGFHPSEGMLPTIGSIVSRLWKQAFHLSEAKHHPLDFKVSSARLQNIIRPKAKYHPPEMAFY